VLPGKTRYPSPVESTLKKIGRIYTTLSLAVLPVALVLVFTYAYSLDEHSPQAQGLPALVKIIAIIVGVLGVNTLVATLLAVFNRDVRPKKKPYLYTLLAMIVMGGLLYFGFIHT